MKVSTVGRSSFFFFVIPALKMYAIQQIAILDTLFDMWGIVSCLTLVFLTITQRKKSIIVNSILLFVLVYLFATLINTPSQLASALSESSRVLIVPLYMQLLSTDTAVKNFLLNLRDCFVLILLVDILLGIIQLAGVPIFEHSAISFLGLDNYAAFIIIPMLTIIFFTSYIYNGHIRRMDIAVYILALAVKILTNSLSALLALIIFGVMILFGFYKKGIRKLISPKKMVIFILIFLIMIVGFRVQNYLEPVFTSLGRDITLSYRTIIWDKVLHSIPDSLLFGYGKTSGDGFKSIVGFSLLYDTQASHPHSFYLSVLFSTGCIGAILFLRMLFMTFKLNYKFRNLKEMYILTCGLIAFFIIAFADDYIMLPYLYMLICIVSFYSLKLKKNNKNINNHFSLPKEQKGDKIYGERSNQYNYPHL